MRGHRTVILSSVKLTIASICYFACRVRCCPASCQRMVYIDTWRVPSKLTCSSTLKEYMLARTSSDVECLGGCVNLELLFTNQSMTN